MRGRAKVRARVRVQVKAGGGEAERERRGGGRGRVPPCRPSASCSASYHPSASCLCDPVGRRSPRCSRGPCDGPAVCSSECRRSSQATSKGRARCRMRCRARYRARCRAQAQPSWPSPLLASTLTLDSASANPQSSASLVQGRWAGGLARPLPLLLPSCLHRRRRARWGWVGWRRQLEVARCCCCC